MIYRRKTYRIDPKDYERFNQFFHEYLLPNQMKNGAYLVGRWATETRDEITAVWQYESMEEYKKIEGLVRADDMHKQAQEKRKQVEPFFYESNQDFLHSTGDYNMPKHYIAASAYITNEKGEVLLVKTYWRDDTWETPGGQVEEGEPIHDAVCREILEETGIIVELDGISGIYQNVSRSLAVIMFTGKAVGGEIRTSEETKEVKFQRLTSETVSQYITRPQMRERVIDAMDGRKMSYSSFKLRPHELLKRMEG